MRAILHIGLPKTGSSSIQAYLKRNEAQLQEASVFLPRCAYPNVSANLLADIAVEPRATTPARIKRGINRSKKEIAALHQQFLVDLEQELSQCPSHSNVVFSSEGLISLVTNRWRMKRLENLVTKHFSDIQVIAYVRPQHQWLRSTFTQELRRGGVPLDLYEHQYRQRIVLKYSKVNQLWSRAFGRKNVSFRPLERERLYEQNLLADFCHSTGLPYNTDLSDTLTNLSLSPEGQVKAMCINLLCLSGDIVEQERREIIRYLNTSYPGKGFAPSEKQVLKIQHYFKSYNTLPGCEDFSTRVEQGSDTPVLTGEIIDCVKRPSFQRETLAKIKERMG